jgi:hypothetical protein
MAQRSAARRAWLRRHQSIDAGVVAGRERHLGGALPEPAFGPSEERRESSVAGDISQARPHHLEIDEASVTESSTKSKSFSRPASNYEKARS